MARFEIDMEENTSFVVATGTSMSCNDLNRHFNYELSDKKAKSNLLKSAAREALKVEERQKCPMFEFSVGSYLLAVNPLVIKWGNCEKHQI